MFACRLLPLLFLALATGCATQRQWTDAATSHTSHTSPAAPLKVSSPRAAAAIMAMPGDICLLHLSDSPKKSLTKQLALYPAGLMDLLALQDPHVKYLHSELVMDVRHGRVSTKGFFPFEKRYAPNAYANSYAFFGLTDFPDNAPNALALAETDRWGKTGYCGDWVAWCYQDKIYSWWNRVKGVRDIFGTFYPPEAIHTADHLANSPDTRMLLEVVNNTLVYPERVHTGELVARLNAAARSANPKIQNHAKEVFGILQQQGLVGSDGQVLQPTFKFVVSQQGPGSQPK